MNEQNVYEIIKEVADHNGNRHRAALTLGCSKRTVDRHIAGYRAEGKAYFIHGNRGRQPVHTLPEGIRADIRDFYLGKYDDANFAHFTDLLGRRENIKVSESTVRNILAASDVLSPRANRNTKREYAERMRAALSKTKSKREAAKIMSKIVTSGEAHPRRPRCSKFGEMIQMDASLHLWFGNSKAALHIAIDDATGIIVGACFELQETLKGYYHVFEQILVNYGIPFMFYTDRRTVFEYRKKGGDIANDTLTQFGYACKQLGVRLETTSIPEAKGRVERVIQSMQSRLPVELRLEDVTTVEQANEFLPDFIAHYNAKFALPHNSIQSVFEKQPPKKKIDMVLAVITERTVDNGHSIRFDGRYWRTLNRHGNVDYLHKGTKGLVIRTLSGGLYYSVDDLVFAMEEIPEHEYTSKNFDFGPLTQADRPRKKYIPPANHPWRLASFMKYARRGVPVSA